jgi:hypothetical protein
MRHQPLATTMRFGEDRGRVAEHTLGLRLLSAGALDVRRPRRSASR